MDEQCALNHLDAFMQRGLGVVGCHVDCPLGENPAGVDTLILGCTHYPLLAGVISYVLGDEVTLVSSADECAKSTYQVLQRRELLHNEPRQAQRMFLTTGNADSFEGIGHRLMGGFVNDVHQIRL